ncbi:MAG: hypothetical protein JXA20_17895 [Spirochaetes bacterium]|nr:hypothetical protein [Spirochaetota bacterium]
MKKSFFCCLAAVCLCLGAYSSAHALGMGAYFTGAIGGGTWLSPRGEELSTTGYSQLGGGLVLDTCVARDNVFNYRLSVGYDRYSTEHMIPMETSGTVSMDADRVSMYNNFGFGIVRSESMRFWLGPQLGIFYSSGSGSGTTYRYMMKTHNLDYEMYGASLGLALGLNFNFGELLTLYLEGGARYTFNYVTTSGSGYLIMGASYMPTSLGGDLMVHGYEGYASVGIMFRIGDSFSHQ